MPWPTPVEPSPSTGEAMARAFPRRPRRWATAWVPVAGAALGFASSFVLWGPCRDPAAPPELPAVEVSAFEELAPLLPSEPPAVVPVQKLEAPPVRAVTARKRPPPSAADPFEARK